MSVVSRKTAFTLIELLVVVAIIGILAALVFPVIGKMRDRAQTAKCASNLRQIHVASTLFSSDNNNTIVPSLNWKAGGTWYDVLAPYLVARGKNSTLFCPANKIAFSEDPRCNYNWNFNTGWWEPDPVKTVSVLRPAQFILAMDSKRGGYFISKDDGPDFDLPHLHSVADHALYLDGHVELHAKGSLSTQEIRKRLSLTYEP